MNNDQFRKLALGAGTAAAGSNEEPKKAIGVLGSRKKASIPMTPRTGSSISRAAFARQMAERYQDPEQQKSSKKTRTPKGIRLGEGYVDRAKLCAEQASGDVAGKDALPAKGLDFVLLERARKGEIDTEEPPAAATAQAGDSETANDADDAIENDDDEEETAEGGPDVDDAFERLEETEVQAVAREKTKKRGQYATTGSLTAAPGQKRSRDQILAELKAAREAAAATRKKEEESALGARFKKIGPRTEASASTSTGPSSRIEIDSRGREVLVLVDEDGREKRKVRKLAAGADTAARQGSDESARPKSEAKKVLGMEVPEFYRKKLDAEAAAEAAKEVTIFDDAGSDYDPLAGLESDDSDSEAEETAREGEKPAKTESREDGEKEEGEASDRDEALEQASTAKARLPTDAVARATAPAAPRNYFKDGTLLSETKTSGSSLDDPHMLAVLRKAKQMRKESEKEAQSKESEREQRLKKLLQNSDRDAEDLDMGFGTNRLEDEEDMEDGERIKLSVWGGSGDGGDGEGGQGGRAKRKRGPKKRKGDGNNAEDVMRVLEKRRDKV